MKVVNQIRSFYRATIPKTIRDINTNQYFKLRRFYYRRKIISFLISKGIRNLNDDEKKVLSYLKENTLSVFPGNYQNKYWEIDVKVLYDEKLDLKYIFNGTKKLFFRRGMSDKKIMKMFRGLSIEQDPESPHRYLSHEFHVKKNDVVYDVGAAEGSFGLSQIENLSKLIIFETDPLWIEALKATFSPWKDKVEIIEKYVSNSDTEERITLDYFTDNNPKPNFIKIDVDGEEMNLLKGSKNFLMRSKNLLKIVICTYHCQDDESNISKFLSQMHFNCKPSDGYMLFYFDTHFKPPYLRRGLLRAEKL